MSKHTPGPWRMEPDGRILAPFRAQQTLGYFTGVASTRENIDQHIPNCRLIAASPSLLEAARLLLDLTHSERNWPNLSCGEETIALRSRLNNLRDIVLSLEEIAEDKKSPQKFTETLKCGDIIRPKKSPFSPTDTENYLKLWKGFPDTMVVLMHPDYFDCLDGSYGQQPHSDDWELVKKAEETQS